MSDNDNAGTAEAQATAEGRRYRSKIVFPYTDLESAVELAQTIHTRTGNSAETDELAVWMGQTASGGTFRTGLSAARIFGLIDIAQGRATLTPLGRMVISGSGRERSGRITAFLNAELFRVMYEQHKGSVLPPAPAIERQMEQLGVSPKQTERARQVFTKSAQYAEFIDAATGRFVKPGVPQADEGQAPQEQDGERRRGGNDGDGIDGLGLDPLLIALLKKIPPTDKGWPGPSRVRWFRTFAMNVSQIYDGDGEPVEMKIELEAAVTP